MGKQNQQSSGVVMHCRRNGVVGPVLVCGGCGKRITDARGRRSVGRERVGRHADVRPRR